MKFKFKVEFPVCEFLKALVDLGESKTIILTKHCIMQLNNELDRFGLTHIDKDSSFKSK